MSHPFVKLALLCSITAGIILFCIIFGGYSSFYRSQNRIQASWTSLADQCRKRLLLLPALLALMEKKEIGPVPLSMDEALEKTDALVRSVLDQNQPPEEQGIKDFENSQTELTFHTKEILTQLKLIHGQDNTGELELLAHDLHQAQDRLYLAKERYNYEASYFNRRVISFPGFLIARLFGLHGVNYPLISDHGFLPARKIFEP